MNVRFRVKNGAIIARAWANEREIQASGTTYEQAEDRLRAKLAGTVVGRGQAGVIARLVEQVDDGWRWKVYTSTKVYNIGLAPDRETAERMAGMPLTRKEREEE